MGACASKQKVKNQSNAKQEQLKKQPNEPEEAGQEAGSSQRGPVNLKNLGQMPEQSQPRAEEIKPDADSSVQKHMDKEQEASLSQLRHGEIKDIEDLAGSTWNINKENKQEAGSYKPEDALDAPVDMADLNQLPMEGRISDAKVEDRYLVGKPLGAGVLSIVMSGTEKKTEKQYAIKIMNLIGNTQGDTPRVTRRGEVGNEIRVLMSLQHRNVLAMKEYYEQDYQVHLVTELLSGGKLLPAICECSAYSELHAQVCFEQILKGIKYLHSQEITHGGIKSEKILLAGGQAGIYHIKIIDFGAAKAAKTANYSVTTHVGSYCYTPPEMLSKKPDATYTRAVDLWSAGVVLFFLLGGSPPFDRISPEAIREATFSFEATPWQLVSENGKDLVSKLLVLDPNRRLSAAEALNHPWFTDTSITKDSILPMTRNALKRFLEAEDKI